MYGKEFSYKWESSEPEALKAEWADALGGFSAQDIAAALHTCRSQQKAPNLPEFSALCRQSMNVRSKPVEAPLTAEERAAARKVAETVSRSMSSKDEKKGYYVNGVLVTGFKQWAVDLMKREASGESLQSVSTEAWRNVLGYPTDMDAKKAVAGIGVAA